MMKSKVTPNLISFVTVRRGDWIMKVSVYKNTMVLIVAQNYLRAEQFFVKQFTSQTEAADFIEFLAKDE